ncbi:hypothetical protein N784_04345 [Pontibacillus litoralis JSM 072002]|uniref:Uncharacterized protein n=1 Tax=Pontibacillus litoralis JSM 072002 TaxID=1385512 RepID=A0A0A5HSM5_9BACI|nr:hypothetical protein N784_04345 [Pontibacillus litoralis JSM 072002]
MKLNSFEKFEFIAHIVILCLALASIASYVIGYFGWLYLIVGILLAVNSFIRLYIVVKRGMLRSERTHS